MEFMNWDGRPAVLGRTEAKAMLKPKETWTKVDFWDVHETGGVMDESAWRERFKSFGLSDVPMLDQA